MVYGDCWPELQVCGMKHAGVCKFLLRGRCVLAPYSARRGQGDRVTHKCYKEYLIEWRQTPKPKPASFQLSTGRELPGWRELYVKQEVV
jgi:hypothetical protein